MNAPPFSLALFGPFEARYNNRLLTSFATDKIRALLAYLAVEFGKPHRRETLSTLLWPNYASDVALRNLRQSIYRLRQTLQEVDPDLPDQLITQNRLTIMLNTRAISLDVSRFTQSIQAARQTEDPSSHLDQILTLYRGDLLQGFSIPGAYAFDEWLNIQREVFHRQAIETLAHFLTLHETRSDFNTVIAVAPKLLALEPWHEETHRQLMRAHLQTGERSRAVAQYQELKTNLFRELGVEPSPASTALLKQIETEAASVPSTPPITATAQVSDPLRVAQHNHIPVPRAPLIGRQPDLDYLTQTLQDSACRLLTISGPGGIGKTRLCIEAAHRLAALPNNFSNGIHFISLAQVENGSQMISMTAQVLGIAIQSRSDPQRELVNRLRGQNILLILDNFEHLLSTADDNELSSATSFIIDVLDSVSGATILVTSREPLAIRSEWIYPLEGLPYTPPKDTDTNRVLDEPAPQLFIRSARRYSVAFDPLTNRDAILEICRLTDGLPLAIEIAATWIRIHTCQEIVQNILHSLDFLTSPFRDVPARQRSIRVILNSTWEQLTPEQQTTLMALSVFHGGFTVQAALFVAEGHILDLSILVDKSLLRRIKNNRYYIHELVSQFVTEKLVASGQEDLIRERHAQFFLADLAEKTVALSGQNPVEALAHIRRDLDNLRMAWNWSAAQANLPLLELGMQGLSQFWVLTGANLEGEVRIQKAITAIQNIPRNPQVASIYSYLMSALAWLQMGTGKNEDAEKNIQTALELADQGGNAERRATALSLKGWLFQNQGRLDEAEAALNEACVIFEETGNQLQLSLALIRTGSVYWWRNQLDKSLEYYEQSLQIEQKLGNKRGINRAYSGLGMAYMDLEKFEQALEYLEKALQLDRELGNRPGMVRNLGHLGNIYLCKGKYDKAAARYQEALEIEQKAGGKNTSAIWLSNLGRVHKRLRNHEIAMDYYEQSIAYAKETGSRHQLCEAFLGKAGILLQQNHLDEAHSLIEEGLTISYEIDRKDTKLRGLILKARWLARIGESQKARQLLESSRETLASEYKENETNARFFYELWLIDQRVEDAQHALSLYETCQAHAEQMEYTERITDLSAFLQNHPHS